MIPFVDLKAATDELREELDAAYNRFMDSGWYVLGKEVEVFERQYARYCDAKHCVGVGTGLDALILALRALDVGCGDEVIVPSNTYIATWLAVSQVGATIVPVEPDPATFNIDVTKIELAMSSATKCIVSVNLYGQPADYDPILEIARDAGAKLVVDNAQAHGARYKGRPVGGIADIECHSFYPSKNLGAYGEAGAVTTNKSGLAERIRVLRNYGSRTRYHNEVIGTNSRIDAIQAAFLSVKLRHLDRWNKRRTVIAELYLKELGETNLTTPHVPAWATPVWHLFVVRCDERDQLRSYLQENGVGTQIHYPEPPHKSEAYQGLDSHFSEIHLPISIDLANTILSLPIGPYLDDSSVRTVIEKTLEYENLKLS